MACELCYTCKRPMDGDNRLFTFVGCNHRFHYDCLYNTTKFEPRIYIEWMNNFISIVNNFYLVIYTDENSVKYIDVKNNINTKLI